MKLVTRRTFLKTTGLAAAAAALPGCATGPTATARRVPRTPSPNGDVRVAVVGVNGRGQNLIDYFDAEPGSRIVALCDVDTAVLDRHAQMLRAKGRTFDTVVDYRDVLDRNDVDVVAIATPNHQHALQAIWACQAGKDVYLEKPASHNIWEGRKTVEAVDKYQTIAQVGSQARSSAAIAEAVAWVRAGNVGKIQVARGVCYKRRDTIGLTTGPQPVPVTVNYDLWLGPAPDAPLRRTKFHYDWHWQWPYGNGDLGNQGVHQLDVARWFLGEPTLAPRVLSVGGRLGYIDDGQTANTQIVMHDYARAPLIFEVRGLPTRAGTNQMDQMTGTSIGVILQCEGGTVVVPASYTVATVLDKNGAVIKEFTSAAPNHARNFLQAVRSRDSAMLNAPIREGHVSAALAHTGNISMRSGRDAAPALLREQIKGDAAMSEAYGRMAEHIAANDVDLNKTPVSLGIPLAIDPVAERFTNNAAANALLTTEYRKSFSIPQNV